MKATVEEGEQDFTCERYQAYTFAVTEESVWEEAVVVIVLSWAQHLECMGIVSISKSQIYLALTRTRFSVSNDENPSLPAINGGSPNRGFASRLSS